MEGLLILLGIGVIIFIICAAVGGTKELAEQNAEEEQLKSAATLLHQRGDSWLDILTEMTKAHEIASSVAPIGRKTMALVGAMAWIKKQINQDIEGKKQQLREFNAETRTVFMENVANAESLLELAVAKGDTATTEQLRGFLKEQEKNLRELDALIEETQGGDTK